MGIREPVGGGSGVGWTAVTYFFFLSSSGIWVRIKNNITPVKIVVPRIKMLTGMASRNGMMG